MITKDDVEKLDKNEINKKLLNLKKELLNFKIQSTVSGSDKPHKKQLIKKEIARLLTFGKQLNK